MYPPKTEAHPPGQVIDGWLKGSVAVAHQHGDDSVASDGYQIEFSVTVEVACRNVSKKEWGERIRSHRGRNRGLEAAIAITQEH